MNGELHNAASSELQPDFFEYALLLAEGQTGDVEKHWSAFVDNLARISDSFARARANVRVAQTADETVTV